MFREDVKPRVNDWVFTVLGRTLLHLSYEAEASLLKKLLILMLCLVGFYKMPCEIRFSSHSFPKMLN